MGFTVHFFGNAPDGRPIRVEAFFDAPARDRASWAITIGEISIAKLPMMRSILDGVALATDRAAGATSAAFPAATAIFWDQPAFSCGPSLVSVLRIGCAPNELNRSVVGNTLN